MYYLFCLLITTYTPKGLLTTVNLYGLLVGGWHIHSIWLVGDIHHAIVKHLPHLIFNHNTGIIIRRVRPYYEHVTVQIDYWGFIMRPFNRIIKLSILKHQHPGPYLKCNK